MALSEKEQKQYPGEAVEYAVKEFESLYEKFKYRDCHMISAEGFYMGLLEAIAGLSINVRRINAGNKEIR